MQTGQDVNMVLDTTNAIKVAILVFQDAPGVAEEILPLVSGQSGRPVLCGKDDVIINLGESGHGVDQDDSTPSGSDPVLG
jgi:hypothetical protein